ncbi:Leucine-rich repeat receptor-like serine/threonine-protein kinase bam2 [Castilleja foliolosa]|uniref:Beta-amylase n=1 Tax=Castilleja foliolosa TaxID=1961234 RepID=A0ABD3BX82_9LAMI
MSIINVELLGKLIPAHNSIAIPLLSPTANCSGRSIAIRRPCKLIRSVLVKSGFVPRAVVGETEEKLDRCSVVGDDSAGAYSETKQLAAGIIPKAQERDFTDTPYIPVYVMLPLGTINMEGELVDPDDLINQLRILKSINVDGVTINCWWGIVEARAPQLYNWSGYRKLFQIVRDLKLKLQVVMSFHECGGNIGDDVHIPLPQWVLEIGSQNPDIFFTDREKRRNHECLTWGIDNERVLGSRTALEVYFDYMKTFRFEFDEFFENGVISKIEIGLGPCGELRYPSHPPKHGWEFPGIGEFQCYDKYLTKSLTKAAEVRGHLFWGKAPDNAGSYNSKPQDTRFFWYRGSPFSPGRDDFDSFYGRFFLKWYSQVLIDHGDQVLALANLVFKDTPIAAKLRGIRLWYNTTSHAAELTAGIYICSCKDGYAPITSMLKKHGTTLNFTCVDLRTLDQYENFTEALANPEELIRQGDSVVMQKPDCIVDPRFLSSVLYGAWDIGVPVASENVLPCYDREGYNKILEYAKPFNAPVALKWHLSAFTYLGLSSYIMEDQNFTEFERFIKRMHGEYVPDLERGEEKETQTYFG